MMKTLRAASVPWLNQRVRRGAALLTTVFLAATIAALTLSPPKPQAMGFLNDKAQHALAFGALALPCAVVFPRALIWILPPAAVFGAAIEVLQPFAGRDADILDFIADLVGMAVGTLVGLSLRPILRRRFLRQ